LALTNPKKSKRQLAFLAERFGVVFMRIKKENPLDNAGFGRAGPGPF
jgi:hypothetical protein